MIVSTFMPLRSRARASFYVAAQWCAAAVVLACYVSAASAQKLVPILPAAVTYDAAGDLFFADAARNQVFEVSLAGTMSVVAGTGEQGFGGDGGPALSAQLNGAQGIAVGSDGTLYIADSGNQRIRAVSNGTIRTVAGSGVRGFSGDGGVATTAALNRPEALALDKSGNLLICDAGNHRIRSVSNGTISTAAGTGMQGFAGDGGAATAAELDSPMGVAVMADGRVVVADSHNHRLRIIGTDGVITTFAGMGSKGYSGDGGAATAAKLFLPGGVSVTAAGEVLFADSDNHRMRKIDAQGVITTVAGDGWQGSASDAVSAGSGSLDTPRSVTVPVYGAATLADSRNGVVREVAADGKLYLVAAPLPRVTTVVLSMPQVLIYGQGLAGISVSGNAAMPQGTVTLLDGTSQIGSGTLSGGASSVGVQALAAGGHSLSTKYAGDGLNPAAVSPTTNVTVQPASVVATANAASMIYGQSVPQMTGTATGILPQDASAVVVSFSTAAVLLSPVESYPITAQLGGQGSGNYALTMSANSGKLTVAQAHSTVQMQSAAQTSYAGMPLSLSALLGSTTSGMPTGEVDFVENGTVVAKAKVSGGVASGTYLSPGAGSHTLTALYAGDGNFLGSTSAPISVTVSALPDFSVSTSAATQSVQLGLIAGYNLALTPVVEPFTGDVTFSVSGLPAGAKASFSPSSVVPGASGANVVLNVQAPATLARVESGEPRLFWCALLPGLLVVMRRKRLGGVQEGIAVCGLLVLLAGLGCGSRNFSATATSQVSRSFPLVVTATSTNLAGSIVAHTVALTLNVQ